MWSSIVRLRGDRGEHWRDAMHAGIAACWESGILGGGVLRAEPLGDAAWLMVLSWPAHKAFCPGLIHPAQRGEMEGGGVAWKVFLGLRVYPPPTPPTPESTNFFFSFSLAAWCRVALVWGRHIQTALLGSNNTKTLAEIAECWQSAEQRSRLMAPWKHLEAGISCWAWCSQSGMWIIVSHLKQAGKTKPSKIHLTSCLHTNAPTVSPEKEPQVPWDSLVREWRPAGPHGGTPQVHHGGSSCFYRGRMQMASHKQRPPPLPLIPPFPPLPKSAPVILE